MSEWTGDRLIFFSFLLVIFIFRTLLSISFIFFVPPHFLIVSSSLLITPITPIEITMTFSTPTNLVADQKPALTAASEVPEVATFNVKAGLAQMLKVLLFFSTEDNYSTLTNVDKTVTHSTPCQS